MSPAFNYVGKRPETIFGLEPKNISEEEYDTLPWELQQAVLNNRGSDGNPLYVERPSTAARRAVNKMMAEQEPDEQPAPSRTRRASEPAPENAPGEQPQSAPDQAPAPEADSSGRIAPKSDAPAQQQEAPAQPAPVVESDQTRPQNIPA